MIREWSILCAIVVASIGLGGCLAMIAVMAAGVIR